MEISWAESSLLVQEDQSKQRQENHKRNHSTSSFISSTTKNKPSLSSALISKYIELTRAGQCGNPRIFAQIKSPGEKDILRLSKSKGLEDVNFAKFIDARTLAPDLSVLVSTVENINWPRLLNIGKTDDVDVDVACELKYIKTVQCKTRTAD